MTSAGCRMPNLETLKRALGQLWSLRRAPLSGLLSMLHTLEIKQGHLVSHRVGRPVAADGAPLPWYTYPCIEFLEALDFSGRMVFEYGSGNSSRFWAARASCVHSVEHDADWYHQLAPELASNQQLSLAVDEDEYVRAIEKEACLYDVIVIDGIHRLRCAQVAVGNLAPDGMVILDNSDWYPTTAAVLRQADLIEVDFSGFGPINYYRWTTSLFLRRDVHLHPRGLQHPQGGPGSIVQVADPE